MQSGLAKTGDTDARRRMISPSNKSLTIEEQCYALGLSRSTYYYKPLEGESDSNLEIMRKIDHQYTEHPAMGAATMESGSRSRPGSMRWSHSKERYGNIKKNHYLSNTVLDAEHHLSGGLCSEVRLT